MQQNVLMFKQSKSSTLIDTILQLKKEVLTISMQHARRKQERVTIYCVSVTLVNPVQQSPCGLQRSPVP